MSNIIPLLTKDCENDCAVASSGSSTTMLGYVEMYDRAGNRISTNPNTDTTVYHCHTCGATWTVKTKNGEVLSIDSKKTFLFEATK